MKTLFVLLVVSFIATTYALYNQCEVGKKVDNLDTLVKVSNCRKTYCRLKKKFSASVEFKFTPDKNYKKLTNQVSADIAGIPFPFIGFDGTNACENLYEVDGETKVSCPVQAGKEYLYRAHINVLEIYPTIKVVVRWALASPEGQLMCFEVPARIVN